MKLMNLVFLAGMVLAGAARADIQCNSTSGVALKINGFELTEEGPFAFSTQKAAAVLKINGEKLLLQGTVKIQPMRVGTSMSYNLLDLNDNKATIQISDFGFANNCNSRAGCNGDPFNKSLKGTFSYLGNKHAISCTKVIL